MQNGVTEILEDKREILRLDYDDGYGTAFIVGSEIEKIVAYGEPGEHCYKPWFAVYSNGKIAMRIPASKVRVSYKEDQS